VNYDFMELDLGLQMACAEHGIKPSHFAFISGVAKQASTDRGPIGRLIAQTATNMLVECGLGNTAPAIHLAMVSKQADWHPQFQETIGIVLSAIEALKPMEKQAFNLGDVAGGAESLAKGVGYGTLGAGVGAGALWWLLSQHALQEDAKAKAMQGQVDYYNQLSSEISDQMRRRYGYGQDPQNGKPTTKRKV